MKKPTKRDIVNLFFSSFLVIGYVICAYFFSTLMGNMVDPVTSGAIDLAIFCRIWAFAVLCNKGRRRQAGPAL